MPPEEGTAPIEAPHDWAAEKDDELETYLLLLLSDSNLPTGGFVASSGLESFYAHGFLHDVQSISEMARYGQQSCLSAGGEKGVSNRQVAPSQSQLASATLSFARSTLHSYCRSSYPFLVRVHTLVKQYLDKQIQDSLVVSLSQNSYEGLATTSSSDLQDCISSISWLDHSYHTLLLNHVARRASKAQGIALLTLYSKAFAQPIRMSQHDFDGSRLGEGSRKTEHDIQTKREAVRIKAAANLIDRLKLDIRRSASLKSNPQGSRTHGKTASWLERGGQHGHLPICWAVFSACLGLSLQKALFLHLFLQARSLFSSSIRLNSLGPYLAHQIMRFQLRTVVNDILQEMKDEGCTTVSNADSRGQKARSVPESDIDSEDAPYSIPDELPSKVNAMSLKPTTSSFKSTSTIVAKAPRDSPVQPLRSRISIPVLDSDLEQNWAWDWPDDCAEQYMLGVTSTVADEDLWESEKQSRGFWTQAAAPGTTFPLGEILQARHDQLHSRLFNS